MQRRAVKSFASKTVNCRHKNQSCTQYLQITLHFVFSKDALRFGKAENDTRLTHKTTAPQSRQRQRHPPPRGCIQRQQHAKKQRTHHGFCDVFFLRRSSLWLRHSSLTWRESNGFLVVVGCGFAVDSNGFYTYQWCALGFVVLLRNYTRRGKSSPWC